MKLWFEFFLNHIQNKSLLIDRRHLEIPLKINIFFIYNYKQTYNFDNLSLLSKNQPKMVKYVKKICFSNLQTYDYLFFTSKIMLHFWTGFPFLKMIPHVSFPNKNLKNFSLSISGSKIQAARTTTTNFTRKLATAKEF